MPDLLTHLFLSLSLGLILRLKSREEGCLILVGGIMVDIERPFSYVMQNLGLEFLVLSLPFHSLLGTLCLSIFLSTLFDLRYNNIVFKKSFILIFLGGVGHLLADMTLHPWEEKGIFLLYPIQIPLSFNLFWSGFIGYPFGGLTIFLTSLIWYYLWNSNNQSRFIFWR